MRTYALIPRGVLGHEPGLQEVHFVGRCGCCGSLHGCFDMLVEPAEDLRVLRFGGATFARGDESLCALYAPASMLPALAEVVGLVLVEVTRLGRVLGMVGKGSAA